MNPYHELFDDPDKLNTHEHVGECNSGMGIPWLSTPPELNVGWDERSNVRRPRGWWSTHPLTAADTAVDTGTGRSMDTGTGHHG